MSQPISQLTDEQLIANYLAGNEKLLEILIKRYLKLIYSFVYRYIGNSQDAEDITQEVFIKVWQNLKKFNPRRNRFVTLQQRQQKSLAPYRTKGSGLGFKTWIFAIAKNTSLDFLKKKKIIPFSEFSVRGGSAYGGENEEGNNMVIDTLADPAPLPNEIFDCKNLAQELAAVIDKLSPKYRAVLSLRYNDHFTFREIAESLGQPLNTIKSQHRRALLILRKLLSESVLSAR